MNHRSPDVETRREGEGEIAAWIGAWVEENLGSTGATADADRTFVSLGLDSIQATMLVGDLEERLGRRLSPTLAWDHPTIRSMAAHLVATEASKPAPAAEDRGALAAIDDLSEAAIDRMLRERLSASEPA